MVRKLPAFAFLQECLRYEGKTGQLFWKTRPRKHFATMRAFSTWNARYAGKEAFPNNQDESGRKTGALNNQRFLAHRVIWKLVTGREPGAVIDHRDRDPSNNRWGNLREATKGQNNINSSLERGVSFDKSRGLWAAYTKFNGRKVFLGRFVDKQNALVARRSGVRKLFGEFAP